MQYFRKIIAYARPYTRFAWLNVLFNILYAVFNVLTIVAFIPVLNILFKQENTIEAKPEYDGLMSLGDYAQDSFYYFISVKISEDGPLETLVFVCFLTLFLFFFKNFFRYAASFVLVFLRNGVVKDLRDHIYRKIVELPVGYFSEKKKGDIIARMTSDVQEVENSFLTSLEAVVREPLTIIIALVIMLVISTKLTLFVFVLLPISGFIISSISKRLKAKSLLAQQETGNFLSFIEETLTGLRVIKGFNAQSRIEEKFKSSTQRFRKLMHSVLHRKTLASPMSEFLGSATIITILWYGGRLVLGDDSVLKPEQFLTYIGLFYLILNPVKALTTAYYNIQKGNASAQRILTVLETENTITDRPDALQKRSFENDIVFDKVSFRYKDDPVLSEFSLKISKGQTVALVGQSGSGKSTLANLITRFYDVESGSILIDGTDIRDITQESLRGLMGIVTQDSILFNDTVAANVSLGVDNPSRDQIVDACAIANATEFIETLPQTYDTNIGDSGNTLSGGQRQRLSIARAVLKNPPIMVLDEATSALDTESEQLVQKALEKMMENRTSLVIAHRLSTIQKADLIVVMKKGRIVEQGKHDELMALGGEYFKLVSMQSL
jgi:subfamily B ATP-binding cassette protein MsbA